MLEIRTFNREEQIHCLLTSSSKPNQFFPVKAIVKDIVYDEINPKYKIMITKFYDSFTYLRMNMFGLNFQYSYNDKNRECRFKKVEMKTLSDLESVAAEERHWIIVEGLLVRKHLFEIQEMHEKLTDFLIVEKLRELKEYMVRTSYKGKYRVDTELEWLIRFRSLFDNKLTVDQIKNLIDVL